jgi:LysM repeat protein
MKLSSLSVKRRPAKKGAFRTLFANVRKKQRASVATPPMPEMDSDVPNLGISRALFVILIIHVVAIAGIFAHSHWFESDDSKTALASQAVIEPAKPLRDAGEALPQISKSDDFEVVVAGDTYKKLAESHGVTEEALRKENDNVDLRSGLSLRIPQRTIVAELPEDLARLRNGSAVLETMDETPAAPPADELRSAEMVETDAAKAAVLVRPTVSRQTGAAAPSPVAQSTTVGTMPSLKKSYTVKSGDTFWKIARAHKSTPDAIMKANRITDARKLKPGMKILVP